MELADDGAPSPAVVISVEALHPSSVIAPRIAAKTAAVVPI
jgi:hypothetical protein